MYTTAYRLPWGFAHFPAESSNVPEPVAPPRPENWPAEWPWPLPEPFGSQYVAGHDVQPVAPPVPPKPAPKTPGALGIEEDGYARFQFGDGPEIRVDVCEAYWNLAAIYEDVEDDIPETKGAARTAEYLKRVRGYLAELGAGAVSTRCADRFDKHLAELVDGVKKADAPAPTPA
jgi:hypothetical protein